MTTPKGPKRRYTPNGRELFTVHEDIKRSRATYRQTTPEPTRTEPRPTETTTNDDA